MGNGVYVSQRLKPASRTLREARTSAVGVSYSARIPCRGAASWGLIVGSLLRVPRSVGVSVAMAGVRTVVMIAVWVSMPFRDEGLHLGHGHHGQVPAKQQKQGEEQAERAGQRCVVDGARNECAPVG